MKITFIGTGHGVPEAHKKCSCTMFEIGGKRYIIDMGCDINPELAERRIPHESIKAVFFTHSHTDHTGGLYLFLGLISWYYVKANPEVYLPSEKLITLTNQYLEAHSLKLRPELKIALVNEGVIYDDGTLKVTAYKTQHCADSFAFLLEAEGKRILCSGDLRRPSVDFPDVRDVDVAILEGAHFDITEYTDIIKERNIKSAYINHYGIYIGRCEVQRVAALREGVAPIPVEAASDGMEITL